MALRGHLKSLPYLVPRLATYSVRSRSAIPRYPIPVTRKSSTQAVPIPGRYTHETIEDPLTFPSTAYDLIDQNVKVEEEEIPGYEASRFYPVHIGEVFQGRYQAVTKLGYGSSSTIWLARDLRCRGSKYVALKVYVHTSRNHREIPVYDSLSPILAKSTNPGRDNIRHLLDSFEISGQDGRHKVLVMQPAQMSLRDFKQVFRPDGGFDENFVRGAIQELLKALEFIHEEAHLVHTDIHPGNLLLGLGDDSQLEPLVDIELKSPVSRKKVAEDRTIYLSRLMRPKPGPMLLSDFGEARTGSGPFAGDIMPIQYRAPEVIMCIAWNRPVDIWSVGLTVWDLLGPNRLFTAKDEDGDMYDAAHLAELIATLGPPPQEFLQRNVERAAEFWDEQGKWLGLAPIPKNRSLEELETRLKDSTGFIAFLRRVLTWMPEDRPTAKELLQDPWLTGESRST
ncbi:CMGC SRPK kinase [Fusarium subglutinans]|uniref:non-specific serine/threonine protein kinase n=1 Tax=Gibberella subglutinans TaxID=42677 RepID=A0A8H5Q7X5_GIBSU|nr:CMGC SRPK kinase [Fusarium subglutinans]KAF5609763.1 CMGC SRPK kinase [Fusarium subglutinans]